MDYLSRSLPPLKFGTCSWKFDAWRGIIYSDSPDINYLAEYSRHFDCVEIDQWFWSLFGPGQIKLPDKQLAAQYASSVPRRFRFAVKMPNALTLTHYYRKSQTDPLVPNPDFLSPDILHRVLECLEPMQGKLGPLMFQFGYLNRQMMASQQVFLEQLETFVQRLPAGLDWCIEPRNPHWLNRLYFRFLRKHDLAHVFQQGYFMPPVYRIYGQFADQMTERVVIRLHGPDRKDMDKRAGKNWSSIVEARDGELNALVRMLYDLKQSQRKVWTFVNNHYEGCAPLTIKRIQERL